MSTEIDFEKLADSEENGKQVAHWKIVVWYRDKADNLMYYTLNYCCKTKAYEWIKKLQEGDGLNMIVSEVEFRWIPKHRIVQTDCLFEQPEEMKT